MRLYVFSCKDLLSDRGEALLLIVAEQIIEAHEAAIKLLEAKGRQDLLSTLGFKGMKIIPQHGVLFENVEERHARDPEKAD